MTLTILMLAILILFILLMAAGGLAKAQAADAARRETLRVLRHVEKRRTRQLLKRTGAKHLARLKQKPARRSLTAASHAA